MSSGFSFSLGFWELVIVGALVVGLVAIFVILRK